MLTPMPTRFGNIKRTPLETPTSRALIAAMRKLLEGMPLSEVALLHGLPTELLRDAWDQHRNGSWDPLVGTRARGGVAARRKLTAEQEVDLRLRIHSFTPDELGLADRVWNKDAVRQLILNCTGFALPQRTLATYLERWGFAPEKPLREFHRRNPQLARAWIKQDYPVIAMQAREVHGRIHWWGSRPLGQNERQHASGGRTTPAAGPSPTPNIVFVVTNRGHLQWLVQPGAPTSASLVELFDRLRPSMERKAFVLIQDRPLFSSPDFIDWSLRNKDWIEFHFLPVLHDAPLRLDTIE